jgi:hypothetical protein
MQVVVKVDWDFAVHGVAMRAAVFRGLENARHWVLARDSSLHAFPHHPAPAHQFWRPTE